MFLLIQLKWLEHEIKIPWTVKAKIENKIKCHSEQYAGIQTYYKLAFKKHTGIYCFKSFSINDVTNSITLEKRTLTSLNWYIFKWERRPPLIN